MSLEVTQKPFHGIVLPGVAASRGASFAHKDRPAIVRPPENGETGHLFTLRVEAARTWSLKPEHGEEGKGVAEVISEQFHRLHALDVICRQKLPDGEVKRMILAIISGQAVVVPL